MPCCKKNKNLVQKVVIPKGMINPGETTIIEIPSNLQKQPIVVAKRKTSIDSCNYGQPQRVRSKHSNSKNRQYQNQGYAGTSDRSTPVKSQRELETTERKERENFLRDLEEFQRARRKLLSNASFLANRDR